MRSVLSFVKRGGLPFWIGLGELILSIAGFILFIASYTTSYYIFGDANSVMIIVLFIIGIATEVALVVCSGLLGPKEWMKAILIVTIISLAVGAIYLLGDRFEGIGYTIITNYDAGHGGEEACWYSIICSVLMLLSIIATVVLGFFRFENREKSE